MAMLGALTRNHFKLNFKTLKPSQMPLLLSADRLRTFEPPSTILSYSIQKRIEKKVCEKVVITIYVTK